MVCNLYSRLKSRMNCKKKNHVPSEWIGGGGQAANICVVVRSDFGIIGDRFFHFSPQTNYWVKHIYMFS